MHVAGRQIPVDLDNGLYEMRGSLVGDWHYIPKEVLHNRRTLYVESGVEVFNGCIDRAQGMASAPGATIAASCIWPSCIGRAMTWAAISSKANAAHPVTGGKGTFAGARGLLGMVDRPVGDQVKTTYRGHIVLNVSPTEGDADTPLPCSTAGTAADQKTSATSGRRAC
ncbi:MAG: hypothetical protein WKF76_12940 [Nocardioidaceae bacterium]